MPRDKLPRRSITVRPPTDSGPNENQDEAVREPVQEPLTPAELTELKNYVKKITTLFDLKDTDWNDRCVSVIETFLKDNTIFMLTIYFDENILRASLGFPSRRFTDIHYFGRKKYGINLSVDNFNELVMWGTLGSNAEQSIYAYVAAMREPLAANMREWPRTVKTKFAEEMNQFLEAAAELRYDMLQLTGIYVSPEGKDMTPLEASMDSSLVKRMNALLLEWYTNINAALDHNENYLPADDPEPLDIFEFWKHRFQNLYGIWQQLEYPQVGHICRILVHAQSQYVGKFFDLIKRLKIERGKAESNAKHLQQLEEPCTALGDVRQLVDVASSVPKILFIFKFIWMNSPYFSTDDHLLKLCSAFSNQIVNACRFFVDLDFIFKGNPNTGIDLFQDIHTCLEDYTVLYDKAVSVHNEHSQRKWNIDREKVFCNVDILRIRCADMLEVCNTMKYFGRINDSVEIRKPQFGWTKAPEFHKVIDQVEELYKVCFNELTNVQDSLIDLHSNNWAQAMQKFREGLKEIEVIIENLLGNVFEVVTNVEEGLEALQGLYEYSKRPQLYPTFERYTINVLKMFLRELNTAKKEMISEKRSHLRTTPRYGGRAMVAFQKRTRLASLYKMLEEAAWLPETAIEIEVKNKYYVLMKELTQTIDSLYLKWVSSVPVSFEQKNLRSLLAEASTPNLIAVNIDRGILDMAEECRFWMQLNKGIPSHVMNYFNHKYEDLSIRFKRVTYLVNQHNKIILSLSNCEKLLFKEHLYYLKRQMAPGFSPNIHWENELANIYIEESTGFVVTMGEFVDDYKNCNLKIRKLCEEIACTLFVSIPPGAEYDLIELQQHFKECRTQTVMSFSEKYKAIFQYILVVYDGFSGLLKHMRPYWYKYLEELDILVEHAFVLSVKKTLKHLHSRLKRDEGAEPEFLVNIQADLKNKKILFRPKLLETGNLVRSSFTEFILSMNIFPRLFERFNIKLEMKLPPYAAMIAADKECQKLNSELGNELATAFTEVQKFITVWNKYRDIWETDKDIFLLRYEKRNPTSEVFAVDINKYFMFSEEVGDIPAVSKIHFFHIDATELKDKIIKHCTVWQKRLIFLLMKSTNNMVEGVYKYCHQLAKRVNEPPKVLHELPEVLRLYKELTHDQTKQEDRIPVIHEQLNILLWFKDDTPLIMTDRAHGMWQRWQEYLDELDQAKEMLHIKQTIFKEGLIVEANQFRNEVLELQKKYQDFAPTSATMESKDALQWINDYVRELKISREKEEALISDFSIFEIDHPPSELLRTLEKEVGALSIVWLLANQWDRTYEVYKTSQFALLDTTEMEMFAQDMYKKFTMLMKELREKNWPCIEQLRRQVDLFRRVLPLINDLKNPSMQKRHWDGIRTLIQHEFDETSPGFTLELILQLNMLKHAEGIAEISNAATMELAIENNLKMIEAAWKIIELDMVPYKDRGIFRIKGVDDIFTSLEEHQTILSAMKGTRYVQPFIADVEYWEKNLTLVLEVLEHSLIVQRSFLYLENIFTGEDIRKQLPREADVFDKITREWRYVTRNMNATKKAFQAAQRPGIIKVMKKLIYALESIQKSLEKYLETKRHIFPRFYFISNDDLLDILGNAKKPENVQPHFKKLFDNINKLKMQKHPVYNRMDAHGMFSIDGEYIDFNKFLALEGPVEIWLSGVEKLMRSTLKDHLKLVRIALKKNLSRRDRWIKEHPGQLCITSSQIQWTFNCTRALLQCKGLGRRAPMKRLRKKENQALAKFSEAVRSNLTKIQRLKIVALVTVEIHARDVVDKMYRASTMDVQAFEWLSQLRFYWDKEIDDCIVRQTNTHFIYGYEYLGNSGRLVITPLTDRCYITLTTALHLYRGGSPKGPAGTGKTETVKDLGKSLAYYVIVINCSEGLDYKSMGRMFSGFAQSGAWGCFDEFNRINIEVLSVVAQQILSILRALQAKKNYFSFEGVVIQLIPTCGIFITMNPGYAGRTELPDNLKSMFRPISMMVPDSMLIAEITLFGEGFKDTRILAKKVFTLFSLAKQQLSKQNHYDFGLRGMVALLRYAGKKRRQLSHLPDEEVVLLAMKDMNIAKLTSDDLPLFNGIIRDLFPGVDIPVIDYEVLYKAIREELKKSTLQDIQIALTKVIQLYETKGSRHSVVILGATGSAKSTTWKLLKNCMTSLKKQGIAGYESVQEYVINPKALNLAEIYGEFNLATNEWSDGVLSSIMRKTCADEGTDEKWILFDGPVDAVWIENMNSVMDDNKVLTLINSERITMPEQVSLLFEVEDLAEASPATVSRCGIVFNDYKDFGWQPYVQSWLLKQSNSVYKSSMTEYFEKFTDEMLNFKRHECVETVNVPEICSVITLCKLLECVAPPENCYGNDKADETTFRNLSKLWFLFCLTWSIGASVNEDGRFIVDQFLRGLEPEVYPEVDTVYEYFVSQKNKCMEHWENKLARDWRYNPDLPFFKIIVPTVDTVRYDFITSVMIQAGNPILIVGIVGTGKTSTAINFLESIDTSKLTTLCLNMSAQTTSNMIQDIIENRVEKRTKTVFVPIGGKKMITFMDDFNMPAKEKYGAQPPLELIRQWIDYGFWYNRSNQTIVAIRDMLIMAAMGPPGGGRHSISNRLVSKFSVLNITFPTDAQIMRIFLTMFNQHVDDFPADVKTITTRITEVTLALYKKVVIKMLPTPTKTHYLFNLRDISKVFQGLLRSARETSGTKTDLLRLWAHECFRIFYDRLNDDPDRFWFTNEIGGVLEENFELVLGDLWAQDQLAVFCEFTNTYNQYEFISDLSSLRKHIGSEIEEYNNSPGNIKLDLVLFKEAVETICHLARIVSQPRGHVLIASIGGGGRQCLARVAAWLCGCNTFKVEISRNYKVNEFREDLKRVYYSAGVKDTPTVFLFTDAQITDEGFLELINNILSTGEVAKLYRPEEFDEIRNILYETAKKSGIVGTHEALYNYFLDRVRSNLHMVICMSPVGDMFRARLRQYPALVSCTTIKWLFDWPRYALIEVALRQLREVDMLISSTNTYPEGLEEEEIDAKQASTRAAVALTFATVHQSVQHQSRKMLKELKRHNYVTPVNYLELVAGYKKMLAAKRIEVSSAANKLRNGLSKIDETKQKVYELTLELEDKNKLVTQTTLECDEYMVEILNQKREADLAQKAVLQRSEVIAQEEKECQEMAESALADLQEAMPALDSAMKALEALNKKDVAEVRSYGKPPVKVEMVLEAVMILKGKEPNWEEAKRELGDVNFLNKLKNFDRDHISDKTLRKIANYTRLEDFEPERVGQVSIAAKSLAMWVIAIEKYGKAWKIVAPRKAKLDEAMAALAQARAKLKEMKDKMEELQRLVQKLEEEYGLKLKEKDQLIKQAENLKLKLERAAGLVEGLSGERGRWEETVFNLDKNFVFLPNDCLLATAFVSYCGPFLSSYRENLFTEWNQVFSDQNLVCTPGFAIKDFLERPHVIRMWNKMGLPADEFSSENGIIVTQSPKWPLVIDPQSQAWKWIKNKENTAANRKLKIVDFGTPDYMHIIERAMRKGHSVLLQNVGETIEPNVLPVLNKILVKKGTHTYIKMAEKLLDYDNDFRLYVTTKWSNPHYLPEIATRTTVVNFAIKEEGLEEQLLGIVVGKEKPKLEETKDHMVMDIANGKKLLIELEDELLRLLTESKGSLLDDDELFQTLQTSRETAINVNEQLIQSIETEKAIDLAREAYRPCATRASILFFVLKDLANIDPMYQFSLDSYIDLFEMSIKRSKRSENIYERISILNEFHTYGVYKNTCRGLFERHKLLFSFMICIKVLEHAGQVKKSDYNYLLKGGVVLNRDSQPENPVKDWLPAEYWDNITELDKLEGYEGIMESFVTQGDPWKAWYMDTSPETASLVEEWSTRMDHFQFVVVLRCLRPDRLSFAMAGYISKTMGKHFIEPPVLDVTSVLEESSPKTPLIFVLSPGVDPVGTLSNLAEAAKMGKKFRSLSLGQGQAPIATKLIKEGIQLGHWVFLANCHLSLSWMPALDKIIETLQGNDDVQADFRLWLSSNPHPDFPISILQNSLKMTTEPPKGLKSNMVRLYNVITDEKLDGCKAQEKFRKLVFSLCWFHAILLERKKFQQLGWNVIYSFNDSDFEVSLNILSIYLDEYETTPWDALKYLIAGVCYGGHVTDDWDRRLLLTYIHNYFNDDAINVEAYKLSSLNDYYIPRDGTLQVYKDYVANFPNVDQPEAFGQHPNADIASLIVEARYMLENLMLLQVQDSADDSAKEGQVMELTDDVLGKLPSTIDYETVYSRLGQFKSPLSVVLLQEISRYNVLLNSIGESLNNLKRAIQGFVVMSSELELIFHCIYEGRVPPLWLKAYPSLLSLGSWTRDLISRVEHFAIWASTLRPPINFWLSAFTFPTGFLTAVLQTAARREGISVDLLTWEFIPKGEAHLSNVAPDEGVLIKGMYLEGASWNRQYSCLCEPNLMELVTMLPVIQFRPVEQTKRKLRGYYNCPCYYYPQRSGDQGREAFIVSVDLKSGDVPSEYWIKRGTAILLSLSN